LDEAAAGRAGHAGGVAADPGADLLAGSPDAETELGRRGSNGVRRMTRMSWSA